MHLNFMKLNLSNHLFLRAKFYECRITQKELHKRTGLTLEIVARFVTYKRISLIAGARIACAIAAHRACGSTCVDVPDSFYGQRDA